MAHPWCECCLLATWLQQMSHHSHVLQDVVGKIQSLESDGRITGVMDDRGRFIYISHEEMVAVAGDKPLPTHSLCWWLACSPRAICTVQ